MIDLQKKLLQREKSRLWAEQKRQKLLTRLGGKCIKCGFLDYRALQIDHKESDGAEERDSFGGYGVYMKIEIDLNECERSGLGFMASRYQLLCANCNSIKRAELQECLRRHKGLDLTKLLEDANKLLDSNLFNKPDGLNSDVIEYTTPTGIQIKIDSTPE